MMIKAFSRTNGGSPAQLPASVEVAARHLVLDGEVCASFAIAGYPAEVGSGWLEPLLTYPGRLDVSLHVEPIPAQAAADLLRRRLARLESSRRLGDERGKLTDFGAETAAEDAYTMAAALARGEEKLHRVGLYLTVHAPDKDTLDAEISQVRALAASLLLDARPATWRAVQGWVTTSPFGVDLIKMRRVMDTSAVAASFPFTSPDLSVPVTETAVLYGLNTASASPVVWDRWGCDNFNSVVLGRSGGGKSYMTKLEALRSLYAGIDVYVIDPEDEYARLADMAGGTCIRLGAQGVRLNPLDLPFGAHGDALTARALFLHTLVAVLLGREPDPAARAALDAAIIATYNHAGITADPRTWARPAPLLRDLATTLAQGDGSGRDLASRLGPYVSGSWRGLFDGPSTHTPTGHLVVFSLRDLADEARTAGTLLALDAIWRQVSSRGERRPRLVIVDEGWLLMRQSEGAQWMYRLAKSARKHWCALAVVTQDAADLLSTELGRAVAANATTQILLRQAPQVLDEVTEAFGLSDGERAFLASAGRGQGLLVSGAQRVSFEVAASPAEHEMATTSPEYLAALEDSEAQRDGTS